MSTATAKVFLKYSQLPTIAWSRKGKNLFQLLSVEANYGAGKRVTDSRQKINRAGECDTCYKIESVEPKVTKGELRNGTATGRLLWKERFATARPVEITSALKYDWVLLPAVKNPMEVALRAEDKRQRQLEDSEGTEEA